VKRETIYSTRNAAEWIASQHRSELHKGDFQSLQEASKTHVTLENLIEEFLRSKKGVVRESTYKRQLNYFKPFKELFKKIYPEPSKEISFI
jgi:predicted nucleotidyltransferase